MNSKLNNIAISFSLMIIVSIIFSPDLLWELGIEHPHVGLLFVIGLLLGPYGALGAVLANILLDIIRAFSPHEIIISAIFSFGTSYLAHKLWYSGFRTDKITKPRLDNIYHLCLFLSCIVVCGYIYSVIHGCLLGYYFSIELNELYFVSYFLNFINIAFIFGVLGIWLSKKMDFIETPKVSEKPANEKLYRTIFILLIIVINIIALNLIIDIPKNFIIGEIIIFGILLFAYLTKPFKFNIQASEENTVIENIIRNFIIITMTIAIIGIIISVLSINFISQIDNINIYLLLMPSLIITDIIIILFFIPGIIILRYIENNVIKPISSFSEIENFIVEDEKIESEGLVEIYSKYTDEKNEIGTLARSYTKLINYNNDYIENINEIEGEKERIKAELDIATKIQAANLPNEPLQNDDFIVDGYSHPAKEVGGDFFDYFMIDDDNLAIVIGDAAGKGVPAALVAMISQVNIRQILKNTLKPTMALKLLNNQLCENNIASMFLTMWLGIYNKKTKKLTYSNAGHNPPLIKENGEFRYMDIESGIVLGVIENFDYVKDEICLTEEIILYTDGITDANNADYEMYGEKRLLKFFNGFKSNENPITPLLNDIHKFTKDAEQYDDMTLLCLRIKDD